MNNPALADILAQQVKLGATVAKARCRASIVPQGPSIVKTIALRGDGVPELIQAIDDRCQYLETTQELARRNWIRLVNEMEHILRDELMTRLMDQVDQASLTDLMAQVAARELDFSTAERILAGS